MRRLAFGLVLVALCALLACGCRRFRRAHVVRSSHAPAAHVLGEGAGHDIVRRVASSGTRPRFVTAVDGALATLEPAGHARVVVAAGGAPALFDLETPCRFDEARHLASWTVPPHIAVDGAAHVCCVHDGDLDHPAGAYCADLRASDRTFHHVPMQDAALGVGSGPDAIAVFATDLACTPDGGHTFPVRFRGDESQPLSMASCAGFGGAIAVAGTRAPGAVTEQTVRATTTADVLDRLVGAPRGEPVATLGTEGGDLHAIVRTADGLRLVSRRHEGATAVRALATPASLALGAWDANTVLYVTGGVLGSYDARTDRMHTYGSVSDLVAVTRVGDALVGAARDGAIFVLATR